jgi:hypothetical protein
LFPLGSSPAVASARVVPGSGPMAPSIGPPLVYGPDGGARARHVPVTKKRAATEWLRPAPRAMAQIHLPAWRSTSGGTCLLVAMSPAFEKSVVQATVLGFPSCKLPKLSITSGQAVMRALARLAGRGRFAVWRHGVFPPRSVSRAACSYWEYGRVVGFPTRNHPRRNFPPTRAIMASATGRGPGQWRDHVAKPASRGTRPGTRARWRGITP